MVACLQPGDARRFWCEECGSGFYLTLLASATLQKTRQGGVKGVAYCPFCGAQPIANYQVDLTPPGGSC
jgi:hypothetical protein